MPINVVPLRTISNCVEPKCYKVRMIMLSIRGKFDLMFYSMILNGKQKLRNQRQKKINDKDFEGFDVNCLLFFVRLIDEESHSVR